MKIIRYILIIFSTLLFSCKDEIKKCREIYPLYISEGKSEIEVFENRLTPAEVYYEDINKIKAYFYVNCNCKIDSVYKLYYRTGELHQVINYKDGIVVGELISYYRNGNIENEVSFINGLRKGDHIFYDEEGNKIAFNIITQILGKETMNGMIRYNKDGSLRRDSTFFVGIYAKNDSVSYKDSLPYSLEAWIPQNVELLASFDYYNKDFTNSSKNYSNIKLGELNYYKPQKLGEDTIRVLVNILNFNKNSFEKDLVYFIEQEIYVIE